MQLFTLDKQEDVLIFRSQSSYQPPPHYLRCRIDITFRRGDRSLWTLFSQVINQFYSIIWFQKAGRKPLRGLLAMFWIHVHASFVPGLPRLRLCAMDILQIHCPLAPSIWISGFPTIYVNICRNQILNFAPFSKLSFFLIGYILNMIYVLHSKEQERIYFKYYL